MSINEIVVKSNHLVVVGFLERLPDCYVTVPSFSEVAEITEFECLIYEMYCLSYYMLYIYGDD